MSDVWRPERARESHPGTEPAAIDERRAISGTLGEARLWHDAARAIAWMLPTGPMRIHLEDRLRDGEDAIRAMEQATDRPARLELARLERDRMFELLQVVTGMRKQLIEEPVREALRQSYRCFSRYGSATQLAVRFADGEVAWTGVVYTFELLSHPQATHAFAWWDTGADGRPSVFTMLALPPFRRPHDAVRAFLATSGSH